MRPVPTEIVNPGHPAVVTPQRPGAVIADTLSLLATITATGTLPKARAEGTP